MLDVRLRDEEGSHVRKTWKAWLLLKKAHDLSGDACADSSANDVVFRKDGGFARVVASDSVKIVPSKMFVRTREDGTPLTEEGAKAIREQLAKGPNDESKFTVVYIPPHFNTRIVLFIYLLWITSSMALFSFLSVPRRSDYHHFGYIN
jgi:E3 ubiquitin-protein ligase DOA10